MRNYTLLSGIIQNFVSDPPDPRMQVKPYCADQSPRLLFSSFKGRQSLHLQRRNGLICDGTHNRTKVNADALFSNQSSLTNSSSFALCASSIS